ncbi:MAG: PorV/PorQ family protein [Candidatus Stahlbacteria bacterium]|nr:PorV/PorQ family protein [Candidatus Stahlbacteria bacterium]
MNRNQKSEVGSQRSEVGNQKSEVRKQKSEIFCLLSSVFCHLSSVICLLSSVFCLLSSVFCSLSYAGWYGAELLSLGIGSRALSLGSAYTSIADDGFAGCWNPAGVIKNKNAWVAAMSAYLPELNKYNFIGIGYPVKRMGFSLGIASLAIDSIPEFPDTLVPMPIGFFEDMELVGFLSCAYKYNKNIEVGATIKHINCNLYNTQAIGWGMDIGICYHKENILLGLVIKDIGGTRIKWETRNSDFRQMNFLLGTAIDYKDFILSCDMGYEYKLLYRLGIEYSIMDLLFLRAGLNENVTAGVGIRVGSINIDYSYYTHNLGNAHQISASLTL